MGRWSFVVVLGLCGCQELRAAPKSAARPAADPFAFDPELFEKKRPAGEGDWMASFHEPAQSFAQYTALPPAGPTGQRRVIVLQPIGPFTQDEAAVLEQLREFTGAYFQLTVRVEKPVALPERGPRPRRIGGLAWTQYHAGTVMADVLLPRLPVDAVCYLGITMSDLFPDPDWNFVFGQASFDRRVGVYSLARYTKRFWGRPETDESKRLFLRRAFHILAHETGHMFSIAHCTANECLMNGTNSLEEMDRQTMHLCPECLRKLQWNLELDLRRHYRELGAIYRRSGYGDLADWVGRRLVRLSGG